jgi:hypothetical protein
MNKMKKSYFPLQCPKYDFVCDSPGVSTCLSNITLNSKNKADYRNCKLNIVDKMQDKIKLKAMKL